MASSFIKSPFNTKVQYERYLALPETEKAATWAAAVLAHVRVHVHSMEGEDVVWSLEAAETTTTLADWMDETDDIINDAPFPAPFTAPVLRLVAALCEPGFDQAALSHLALDVLGEVVAAANYLGAASKPVTDELLGRLRGKGIDELRALLGAADDLSVDEQAEALAEPMFTLDVSAEQSARTSEGPPMLKRSLSTALANEHAIETVLAEADCQTLVTLKGVDFAWRTRVRRELFARLCRREGQPPPPHLDSVSHLNIECLVNLGRPWEAAVAGRRLRSLQRLFGYGFEVDVAAVREAAMDGGQRGPFGEIIALRQCMTGEGDPPHELLLTSIACAASGVVRGVPVRLLRDDRAIGTLDLSRKSLGVSEAQLLGLLLCSATSVVELKCVPPCLNMRPPRAPAQSLISQVFSPLSRNGCSVAGQ
jgi:hypothetical protein